MSNGDVIPHFLKRFSTERYSDGGVFDEVKLLLGEVKGVIYPDDKRSRSKKAVEYIVYAQKISNGFRVTQEYRCVVSNLFGGLADKTTYTLRVDDSDKVSSEQVGTGSKVVFICIGGEKHRGLIVGGVRDPKDDEKLSSDDGLVWQSVFNGVSATINKDGEFKLLYKGMTDIDGKVNKNVEAAKANSYASFTKDGNVNVTTPQKMIVKPDKGLEIGAATDKMLLASTYREQESKCNDMIKQNMTKLQGLLTSLSAIIGTASTTPVLPGAPVAALAPAVAVLVQASQCAGAVAQAITVFEQQKDKYLSKNHKND